MAGRPLEGIGHVGRAVAGADTLLFPRGGFVYEERRPPEHVSEAVVSLWRSAVSAGAEHLLHVVPDGCVELSVSDEAELLVFGPNSAGSDLVLAAGRQYRGVRLRPGAARAVLGVDARDIAGQAVDGLEFRHLRRLRAGTADAWQAQVCGLVEDRRHALADDAIAIVGARTLAHAPRRRVPEVARSLAISDRQFRRRFERAVGLPPSTFRRIARMQAAMAAGIADPARPLASIAHEHGYSDQAHLTREVLELAGATPVALLGRRSRRGSSAALPAAERSPERRAPR